MSKKNILHIIYQSNQACRWLAERAFWTSSQKHWPHLWCDGKTCDRHLRLTTGRWHPFPGLWGLLTFIICHRLWQVIPSLYPSKPNKDPFLIMSITATAILGMRTAKTLKCDFTLLQMHLSTVVMGKWGAESCRLQELPVCARLQTNAPMTQLLPH